MVLGKGWTIEHDQGCIMKHSVSNNPPSTQRNSLFKMTYLIPTLVNEQMTPPMTPTSTPAMMLMGPSRALMVLSWPVLMAKPMQMLYPLMATTSSNEAAATCWLKGLLEGVRY